MSVRKASLNTLIRGRQIEPQRRTNVVFHEKIGFESSYIGVTASAVTDTRPPLYDTLRLGGSSSW